MHIHPGMILKPKMFVNHELLIVNINNGVVYYKLRYPSPNGDYVKDWDENAHVSTLSVAAFMGAASTHYEVIGVIVPVTDKDIEELV